MLPRKTLGSIGVPSASYQNFEHIAVFVDDPPEPVRFAAHRNHDLVEMPFVGRRRAVAPDLRGETGTEPLAPDPGAFMRDDRPTFREKIFDIAQAQRRPMVRPDGIGDDGRREAEALRSGM
jgi:hypothetical protein